MPRIEGFRVQNYRVLKDVTLGRLWNQWQIAPLTPLVAVIGKNGTGKSSLFDAFGFLADCLSVGVEEACDLKGRGGFKKLVSAGTTEAIRFEVYYRERPKERPITYEVEVALDHRQRPYVRSERLRQRRAGQRTGRPYSFLNLDSGAGQVWAGEKTEGEEGAVSIRVELADTRHVAIATYGTLREHPRIVRFRNFIQNWYLSYFTPDAARSLPLSGPQKRLNVHGDNLGNVVQYMERENQERFRQVLSRIAERIPGIDRISTAVSQDDRLLLQFNDKGFKDPFYAQQMSDGTLKMFAYLLLLEDPDPPSFICIEEPENGLYHKLMESLAHEFRAHATRPNGPQVFITTHQPYFVDALEPEETWVLEKGEDGFAAIRHASDNPIVSEMVKEGRPLGSLWYSDYLDAR